MSVFTESLSELYCLHKHLCPRQVLGLRIGIFAGKLLNIPFPQHDKRIFCFVETDGCFADGVMVATGCSLGHRTMRLVDYGKVAATFVDTISDTAFRVSPRSGIREAARSYAPECKDSWHTQQLGYQLIPDDELLCSEAVTLTIEIKALIGLPSKRVTCSICHEEIINQREEIRDGQLVCRHCAGNLYYKSGTNPSNILETKTISLSVSVGEHYVS